jgi:ferrous iron transport protein A
MVMPELSCTENSEDATNTLTLMHLPIESLGLVLSISPQAPSYDRMLELGLVKGTRVKVMRSSPLGDPKAYLIRGAVVALRKEDTELVAVKVCVEGAKN